MSAAGGVCIGYRLAWDRGGGTAEEVTMATRPQNLEDREIGYPSGDGQPMAETPIHCDIMMELILLLREWYANDPNVYVVGNMFLYYEKGKNGKRVSPDVQVTLGIPKSPHRRVYQTWVEKKAPDVVFEITSQSSQAEDTLEKFELYRDVLKVPEYFLFDPEQEYLEPSLQGYRLVGGDYVEIEPVEGRLPSEVLKLHLQRSGTRLRLYDPVWGEVLPTPEEARLRAEQAWRRSEEERERAEQERQQAE